MAISFTTISGNVGQGLPEKGAEMGRYCGVDPLLIDDFLHELEESQRSSQTQVFSDGLAHVFSEDNANTRDANQRDEELIFEGNGNDVRCERQSGNRRGGLYKIR
jgi:hypothetical protein